MNVLYVFRTLSLKCYNMLSFKINSVHGTEGYDVSMVVNNAKVCMLIIQYSVRK